MTIGLVRTLPTGWRWLNETVPYRLLAFVGATGRVLVIAERHASDERSAFRFCDPFAAHGRRVGRIDQRVEHPLERDLVDLTGRVA